ncbi:MAG TPA: hypothetical protein PKZ76_15585, partial [Xanthomonadaceae bacterium]|nr:hypothetical protein [Xanthomonadaceae bacterium]
MNSSAALHPRRRKSYARILHSQFAIFVMACMLTFVSGLSGMSPVHAAQRLPGNQVGGPGVPAASGIERETDSPDERRSDTEVRRTRNPELFVEPGVVEQLAAGGSADLLIHFGNLPDFERFHQMDWEERGRALYDTMEAIRLATQGPVIEELRARGVEFRSYWVGNNMEVFGVDHETFMEIVTFESVHAVVFNPEHFLIEPEEPFGAGSESVLGGPIVEPNLTWVGAPDAWAQGIRGQDVVVGLNDTSPRFTHNLLVGAYRGNIGGGMFDRQHNWIDP